MNISPSRLVEARERDGKAAEQRPAYVEDALRPRKRLGYRDGLPLVDPPEKVEVEDVRLGDDVTALYDHYVRGDDLLLPDSADFLRELAACDRVRSVEDIATELNADRSVVRRAMGLHGLEVADGGDETEDDGLTLPSGESLPTEILSEEPWRDKLVLAQLFTDGLSIAETAMYLSRELDEKVTERDVYQAAQSVGILEGGDDDGVESYRPTKRMEAEDAPLKTTPWE